MIAQALFHESLSEAIKDCINACGGTKQVAAKLWPEKAPEAAHRLLLSCLNEDRPERLTPEQFVLVLRMAREKGCHIGVTYLLRDLGYADPVPVDPQDEFTELQRQFTESVKLQARTVERMERLTSSLQLRSVA